MAKKSKKETLEKEAWEVPEIDLNLRHYSGHPSDVIKKIKLDIERYVNTPGVPDEKIKIYSAIYNALNYYKDISYIPSAEFGTGDTYLSSTIGTFNKDYEFLDSRYNSPDPTQEKVIRFSGRIKSPLSFVNKVKEKMTEYVEENRDYRHFNESLRDLIGMRIIVDVPKEYEELGPQAEANFLYKVAYDLMEHRGILRDEQSKKQTDYSFIPVNSRYDPTKLEKMKNRYEVQGLNPELYDINGNLVIGVPEKRPEFIDRPEVDSVMKDYVKYPKFSGYQSLHLCVHPKVTQDIEKLPIPRGIIPPASRDYSFEYQIRSTKQDEFAERGFASHKSSYKPHGDYHRLQVPFYITFDSAQILSEDVYNIDAVPRTDANQTYNKNKLRLRNFGESYHKFYGHTFEEFFNIPFKKMRDLFDSNTRNEILARTKIVTHDEETDTYQLVDSTPKTNQEHAEHASTQAVTSNDSGIVDPNSILICLSVDELDDLRKAIAENNTVQLTMLLNKLNATDNMYTVSKVVPDEEATPANEQDPSSISTTKNAPKSVKLISLLHEPEPEKTMPINLSKGPTIRPNGSTPVINQKLMKKLREKSKQKPDSHDTFGSDDGQK